jgi:hypothetical protein
VRFTARQADDGQRQQHVVEHAAVEQQLLVLEDQAEVAAQVAESRWRPQGGEVLAIDHDAARSRALDGREQA